MNLFKATLDLAKTTTRVRYGKSTELIHDNVTIKDENRNAPIDYFTGGAMWLLDMEATSLIKEWNKNSHLFILERDNGTPYPVGTKYAVSPYDWTLDEIKSAINSALANIGSHIEIDDSIVTQTDVLDYEIPEGVQDIRKITYLDTELDVEVRVYNYYITGNTIHFSELNRPLTDSVTLRLYYVKQHPEVVNDNDEIYSEVHPDLLRWSAAVELFRTKISQPEYVNPLNIAIQKADIELNKHRIDLLPKPPIFPNLVDGDHYSYD